MKVYVNLESAEVYCLNAHNQTRIEYFEKNNIILTLSKYASIYDENYAKQFWFLRYWFCEQILTKPQKEVIMSLKTEETLDTIFKDMLSLKRKLGNLSEILHKK